MNKQNLKYILAFVMGMLTGIMLLGLPFVIRRSFGIWGG